MKEYLLFPDDEKLAIGGAAEGTLDTSLLIKINIAEHCPFPDYTQFHQSLCGVISRFKLDVASNNYIAVIRLCSCSIY
jgi:hypothetical protein